MLEAEHNPQDESLPAPNYVDVLAMRDDNSTETGFTCDLTRTNQVRASEHEKERLARDNLNALLDITSDQLTAARDELENARLVREDLAACLGVKFDQLTAVCDQLENTRLARDDLAACLGVTSDQLTAARDELEKARLARDDLAACLGVTADQLTAVCDELDCLRDALTKNHAELVGHLGAKMEQTGWSMENSGRAASGEDREVKNRNEFEAEEKDLRFATGALARAAEALNMGGKVTVELVTGSGEGSQKR
ncbi:hypothetical protein BDK51DRAFT_25514 [Blyttiomyces helicus]|uniref:Uncharacterized protein n=1 Tax=Blyttiomyces helicus TaxID=388810 RepID=A0A4V1ISA4_9FUNG|nr:hypothetical protein BDK51DRAFT_25514 [Blyttiomyces helicus]|eukprot:RKO92867.1 hypothetical protein BDK51DRAFT_25514 [Blyttiomyces helicus]